MVRKHLFTFASLLLLAAVVVVGYQRGVPRSPGEDKNVAAVRAVIEAQAAAWNRGDVDGYMEGYAKEETTTFVSGDTITRGWQTVHDRYQSRHHTREQMGTPAFSELEVTPPRRTPASPSSSAAPPPAGASSTTTRRRNEESREP